MKKTKIVVVDDHRLFLEGVRGLLDRIPNFEVVATASDGNRAISVLNAIPADVIVLDISMPEMDGQETAKRIIAQFPEVRILIVSMHNSYSKISDLMEIGVDGYILKNRSYEELVEAIKTIRKGEKYWGKEVRDEFIEGSIQKKAIPKLTEREKDVLRLIAKGHTSPEIGDILCMASTTADQHRRNLLSKTGCRNSLELVGWAYENGYGPNKP